MAPAFIARAKVPSSGKAVMKMNGTCRPRESKWVCSSTPLMDGMRTSEITHDMPSRRSDFRNSSADANVKTVYPCDLTRLLVDARTDASSSIIAITGSFFGNKSSFGEPT